MANVLPIVLELRAAGLKALGAIAAALNTGRQSRRGSGALAMIRPAGFFVDPLRPPRSSSPRRNDLGDAPDSHRSTPS
jgi:hypothetical protein